MTILSRKRHITAKLLDTVPRSQWRQTSSYRTRAISQNVGFRGAPFNQARLITMRRVDIRPLHDLELNGNWDELATLLPRFCCLVASVEGDIRQRVVTAQKEKSGVSRRRSWIINIVQKIISKRGGPVDRYAWVWWMWSRAVFQWRYLQRTTGRTVTSFSSREPR